jgi:outer membrane protein insertion porin family
MISKPYKTSRFLLASAFGFALSTASPAMFAQAMTVADIRLEGLQRISASTVFALLNISVGDRIDNADVANIIRDVFSSNYFEQIEVSMEDNVLVIRLEERPTVSAINFEGNKLIKSEMLLENLSKAGLAVGQVYMPQILEGMQLALEEQYVAQGMYGADVELDVEEQERNRVALNINITEGKASKIVHINIEGNASFNDDTLLDLFELKETHLTSFFRKDDRYAREKINGDLERLTSFYMDQGYINFEVTSSQVSISPDRSQVYITINISEGEVYTVDQVELAGNLVDLEGVLRLLMQVRPGQIFSQRLVTGSSEFMKQVLGNAGYFFAEVEGVPNINEDTKTVDITFIVEPGSRTYVNRISFRGNTNTVDEVLRREMRQMEGSPASRAALEQSRVRMQRLGFFSEVEYDTTNVPGVSDQIDVDFTLQEQLSGSIQGSIGYGQLQGFVISANLMQNNFLGTGKSVGIGANTSRFSTNYNFNYFDPYYTVDGVSRGFSISYSTSDFAKLNLASFSTNQVTFATNYGYQLSEIESLSFNFALSNTSIDSGFGAVQEIKSSPTLIPGVEHYMVVPPRAQSYLDFDTFDIFPIADGIVAPISELPPTAFNTDKGFLDREGSKFNNLTVGVTWLRSTLNLGLFPTAGGADSLSFEMTVPGSDLSYFRFRYFKEMYIPIRGEWIIHSRLDLGYGDGYGRSTQLPFFQNFYAGGPGTIRGFERNTLGPRSTFPQDYIIDYSGFIKDGEGNIILDPSGFPVPDPSSPLAYYLAQARGEDGMPLFDESGNPVFHPELARRSQFGGRPFPFGGNIQTTGTVELLFPLPFVKDRSRFRTVLFVDAGNVFSSYCSDIQRLSNNCSRFSMEGMRYSAGVSVTWFSGAMGLMSFSLAKPFNTSTIDETEVFQFNIGNTF